MDIKIVEFLLLQNQLTQFRKINLLYRGDNIENIYKRYGIINDNSEENKKELLKRIFLIGDKSKYFYNSVLLGTEIHSRSIELTNEDDITIIKVFEKFNKATKSKKEHIKNYFKKNSSLLKYFEDKKNINHFLTTIRNSSNPLSFRNYYLKILHQLFFVDYRNNSHFVSSSKDKEISKIFSGKNGIIFHCWQPNLSFFRKNFEVLNLPRQESLAFKEQKEFSFLAGILPHYISAIEFINENKIYFNPQITQSEIDIFLFFNGLNIDQSDFSEIILKTKFRKYFTINGLKYNEKDVCK